jgi:phosphatidylserine/phosphatidylglycerophosphate/cardiolipin synthase-like enzyme
MLNVAVSRAQNCFLVIGDMELFTEGSRARPSRLLARHLYKRPENQLVNIVPSVGYITETLQSHVISGPDQHEKVLRQVLQQAREKILISSPFLSISAFTEEMLATMQECVRRGVKVFVATDSTFDVQHETVTEPARLARNRLSQIGATVWVVDTIHAKTLCMDSQLLVEGSFNWLSATRELEKARVERSLISENEERTRSYIEDAWEEIEGKPKKVWLT